MKIWTSLPLDQHIARFIGYLVEEDQGNIFASLVSQWYPNGSLEKYILSNPNANREQLVGTTFSLSIQISEPSIDNPVR